MLVRIAFVAAAATVFASSASAQSFNVDIGAPTGGAGVPSAAYGAAAGQPGVWNAVDTVSSTHALVGLGGAATGVTLAGGGFAGQVENNASTSGDDEALLDDFAALGPAGLGPIWSFQGLETGHYALYTYAWPGEDLDASVVSGVSGVCGNSPDVGQTVGGQFFGQHVQGVTYALHHLEVPEGGSFCIQVGANSGHAQLNGFQLVKLGPPIIGVFCPGDGSGTSCPCGNLGAVGRGCANSVNAQGASLWVSGDASVSNDQAYFDVQWMPNSTGLLIQGTAKIGGGVGSVFGDGLRCVGGTVRRISSHTVITGVGPGTLRWPSGGELPVSFQGGATAGSTFHYQVWYRNAASFCTSDTFNLTNGMTVTWGP